MSLKNRQVIFHIKRYSMTNVYLSGTEIEDVVLNTTQLEFRLYVLLKNSAIKNPSIDYYSSKNLANLLNVAESTLNNTKASLKKKGYALTVKFKDENNEPIVRVVVGKDQVELYNLGINVEITNSKAYNKLLKQFPITNSNLSKEEKQEMVDRFNEHYLKHKSEFN